MSFFLCCRSILHILLLFIIVIQQGSCDFIYPDFNHTLGLVWNGDVSISACHKAQAYVSMKEKDDDNTIKTSMKRQGQGTSGLEIIEEVSTNERRGWKNDNNDDKFEIQFGHRDEYKESPKDGCETRMRLTPSSPSKVGSMFYEKRVPVIKGFDTTFSFQVSDHSRVCSIHVDPTLTNQHHRSCAVHGGDGFAFVIHSDPRGARAIGKDGQELGYGGIVNSIAIEFDMWTNVDTQDSDDIFHDHIEIHSGGSNVANSAKAYTLLGQPRPCDLASGQVHRARVQYLPYLEERYLDFMTANENLHPYLMDNGEGRRLGTLAVFIDDGVTNNKPILAIPLNFSILLDLPQGLAYAGFTASTGEKWEKHDIIDWHWCDSIDCQGDPDEIRRMESGTE